MSGRLVSHLAAAAACCIALAPAALADGEAEKPVTIEGAIETRFIAKTTGEPVRLLLWTPEAPAPAEGYPVLYAFDGDDSFATLTDLARTLNTAAARAGVAPVAVAAIAPEEASDDARIFNLTPPSAEHRMPARPHGKPWPKLGGGDAFLAMVEAEIKPRVRARIAVDESAETLFGHSLGGLMVLHRLATDPERFDCHVASSPSIWVNDRQVSEDIMRMLAERPTDAAPLDLHLSVGSTEEELGAWERLGKPEDVVRRETWVRGNAMVTNAKALADRTAAEGAGRLHLTFREYPGLNHLTARTAASIDAVRTALECGASRRANVN